MASSAQKELRDPDLIKAAGARCACMGECGHNHAWEPGLSTVRCGAPHGLNIVRKLGHPSLWRSAPLQGFISSKKDDEDMKGPRTHERGKFVVRGHKVDFAHAELFDVERISQVWLSGVVLGPGIAIAMCQFCARHVATKQNERSSA